MNTSSVSVALQSILARMLTSAALPLLGICWGTLLDIPYRCRPFGKRIRQLLKKREKRRKRIVKNKSDFSVPTILGSDTVRKGVWKMGGGTIVTFWLFFFFYASAAIALLQPQQQHPHKKPQNIVKSVQIKNYAPYKVEVRFPTDVNNLSFLFLGLQKLLYAFFFHNFIILNVSYTVYLM